MFDFRFAQFSFETIIIINVFLFFFFLIIINCFLFVTLYSSSSTTSSYRFSFLYITFSFTFNEGSFVNIRFENVCSTFSHLSSNQRIPRALVQNSLSPLSLSLYFYFLLLFFFLWFELFVKSFLLQTNKNKKIIN